MPRVRPDAPVVAGEQIIFSGERGALLRGMIYRHPASEKIILFFAGRSSNLAKVAAPAMEMLRLGVSVFVFEYRGFGETPGRPTLKTLMDDGLAAYGEVIALGYEPKDIVLYGESLGSSVATYVAARKPASGLVLQSGFSSLERLAKDLSPFFRLYPSSMFAHLRLASDALLKQSHPPLLVIHGDKDDVIHMNHSLRLAAAAGESTTLVILRGAGHFLVHRRADWHEAMRSFLASL